MTSSWSPSQAWIDMKQDKSTKAEWFFDSVEFILEYIWRLNIGPSFVNVIQELWQFTIVQKDI